MKNKISYLQIRTVYYTQFEKPPISEDKTSILVDTKNILPHKANIDGE